MLAPWVGLFELVLFVLSEFGSWPFGLADADVGDALEVSAEISSDFASTGVAALLSTYACESVTKTATAIPAPDFPSEASASVLTFVLTRDVSEALPPGPELLIQLVPES